jgi:DNA-binding NarL/FixJ family response regulator
LLIVEDHPSFTELLLRSLRRHKWLEVVGCAANGRDGVALASATRPDIVLMDIEMPVMDGIEATRLIVERLPAVVFVLTAAARGPEHERALSAGAREVLPKTVDPTLLIAQLQSIYLERSATPDGVRPRASGSVNSTTSLRRALPASEAPTSAAGKTGDRSPSLSGLGGRFGLV